MHETNLLWGIDLGGTKIEGVVTPRENPLAPIARIRVSTEREKGYDHILFRMKELVEELAQKANARPTKIGIGTPGALDPATGNLHNSNTACLNGKPLLSDFGRVFGVPVRMENDANCFALAEALFGAAKGAKCVFGIIMGTGVGGGIVIDGRTLTGSQGIAGEWGHTVLIPDGEQCYCGRRGCVETVISGPAIERYYAGLSSTPRALAEIARRAEEDDEPHARATIQRLLSFFGKAVGTVINILDPDVIVLGGGVSNLRALRQHGEAEVLKNIFSSHPRACVVPNSLGDSAGVFGAALLAT